MGIEIEIEKWPEPDGVPPASGGGRWRLIQVGLAEHDADTDQLQRVTREGQQGA